ncbi:50S ribosomal protein L17 [Tetrabaena socialis]|uniref:Large ribosomal subunit protein bL17c n=1 Tax=Tetrabaena socialis TaxID=47790 RepID=A0A2J8A0A1_9CHLO|nr:50S ribosomal protein L17 [Tetrabaena socialis]|eukprot:PNH05908.1 50S ribosomal protein L17 [Tetrabaena socialis]
MASLHAARGTFSARAAAPVRSVASVRAVSSRCVMPVSISSAQTSSFLGEASLAAPSAGMKWTMMRHGCRVKHLGRPADQRKALIRSLVTEVIRHGAIRTTKVKAMVIRKYVDHMITLAKDGSLHARRQAMAFLFDKDLVVNLFENAPERYAERPGGYTRVKTEPVLRRGDACEMAVIELV